MMNYDEQNEELIEDENVTTENKDEDYDENEWEDDDDDYEDDRK